jgi:hypothetical protein
MAWPSPTSAPKSISTRPASSAAAAIPTATVWSRRLSLFGEGLVGITHATDGYYPKGETLTSTATGFTYALGGGVNYNLYHRFELRVMSHYFVTELPNGGTNQQRDIQVSAGVNWHFGN